MSLAYITDEIFEAHVPPRAHPERPERLRHLRERLRGSRLEIEGDRLAIREATDDELGLVHTAGYLGDLEKQMPGKSGWLDADTYFSEDSWRAARVAAAAATDVALAVLSGRAGRGVALVRPPGHHAEADRAMGFCLFNNVAVAAAAARAAGASRVAILDFDVHHGNGTQHIFERDPSVLFLSVHQHPYYPGTGAPSEAGKGDGIGATVNVGLPKGCGDADYLAVFEQVFEPALTSFSPDLMIVSAGFDAAAVDPLAEMEISASGYRGIAERLCGLADRHASGRLACVLEGGYDLEGLADGVEALVETMFGSSPEFDVRKPAEASASANAAILETLAAHSETLAAHSETLAAHSKTLAAHSETLAAHSETLGNSKSEAPE